MSDPRRELPPELEGLDEWGQAYREQVQAEPEAARAARRARLLAALPAPQAQAEPVLQAAGPAGSKSSQGRSLLPWALGAGLLIGVLWALVPGPRGAVQPDWRLAQEKAAAPAVQPEAASAVQIARAPTQAVPAATAPALADPAAPPRARSAPQAFASAAPAKPAVADAPAAEPPVEARPLIVAAAPPAPASPAAPPAAQAGPAAEQAAERVALAERMAKKAEAAARRDAVSDRQAPPMASTLPAPQAARNSLTTGLAGRPMDALDELGRTALMRAALAGWAEGVDALLREGANPKLRDREGLDAAALAERAGHRELAARLRAAAAAASAPQP